MNNHQPMLWAQSTKKLFDGFCRRPQGSIYITGPPHSGRSSAIKYLVDKLTGGRPSLNPIEQLAGPSSTFEPQESDPQHYRLETIQRLVQRLSLAPPDLQSPHLVVIDDFDLISLSSQNALLKCLEEPGRQTSFILAASNLPGRVLTTIISRCQQVEIRRPTQTETLDWIRHRWPTVDDTEASQTYLKADGWPAVIVDILDLPEASVVNQQIAAARQFLGAEGGPAERLIVIQKLTGDEAALTLQGLLSGLRRNSRAALTHLAAQNEVGQVDRWRQRLLTFDQLDQTLEAGASPAAVGLALSLFDQPRPEKPS